MTCYGSGASSWVERIDWREALWDGHRPYIMLSSAWVT